MTSYELTPQLPTTETPIAPEHGGIWRRRIVCALMAGVLVFAHGCHGPDEDHELFGWGFRIVMPTVFGSK